MSDRNYISTSFICDACNKNVLEEYNERTGVLYRIYDVSKEPPDKAIERNLCLICHSLFNSIFVSHFLKDGTNIELSENAIHSLRKFCGE